MKQVAHVLPDWLEPVLAFVNTVDVETGVDDLAAGPIALSAWLTTRSLVPGEASGLATGPVTVSRSDYRLAVDLRTGLRRLALMNNGGDGEESEMMGLRRALERLPLVAELSPGTEPSRLPVLRPHRLAPARAALGVLVAGYARAVSTGDWTRIRRCPADDCAWAFWDSSAKGTRRWCTMRVCGNRAKVRAFAQRRAAQGEGGFGE